MMLLDMVNVYIIGVDNIYVSLVDDVSLVLLLELQVCNLQFLWVNNSGLLLSLDLFDSIVLFYVLIVLGGDNGDCIELFFVDILLECVVVCDEVGEVILSMIGGLVCCFVLGVIVGKIYWEDLVLVSEVEVCCIIQDFIYFIIMDEEGNYIFE